MISVSERGHRLLRAVALALALAILAGTVEVAAAAPNDGEIAE
jgi:hypothetical protein